MPCYRCGTRQADPEAGKASPWKRGVLAEHQVLICPDCFPSAAAELDRCVRCDGARLIRRLDQVECLDCRHVCEAAEGPPPGTAAPVVVPSSPAVAGQPSPAVAGQPSPAVAGQLAAATAGLADEVARALDRVLRRS